MRYVVELVFADQLKPGDSFLSGSNVFIVDRVEKKLLFYRLHSDSDVILSRNAYNPFYHHFIKFWRVVA